MRGLVLIIALGFPLGAQAKTPLKDVTRVQEGLIAIGMADMIRKECKSISPRMVRAYRYLKSLEAFAIKQGYSEAEIDAYVNNKPEGARLLGVARARLAQKGAVSGSPDTFCVVGKNEILKGTQVGHLLKVTG